MTLAEAVTHYQRELVAQALARNNGKAAKAAAELGVRRSHFYRLCARLGVNFPKQARYREPDSTIQLESER